MKIRNECEKAAENDLQNVGALYLVRASNIYEHKEKYKTPCH